MGLRAGGWACALAGATLAAGCSNAPAAVKLEPLDNYPQVAVTSDLKGDVVMDEEPALEPLPGGAVRVTLPVRYLKKKQLAAQYRFRFFDVNGTPQNPNPGWKSIRLVPRTKVYLTGVALEPGSTRWEAELRPEPVEQR